ncbi:hypothetical protein [Microbacterium sp. BDGP8]|uniref:hypothetical protein n=1 Tax=Microbacterium sp. BDGP8 TaxID=3035531 RepID=UPI00249F116D|nr:hypothetical protein [Microbacterium sp. BDGP8]WHE35138.1 hypothetical protein P6897_10565 [Microbacterium sp. BDGP8]
MGADAIAALATAVALILTAIGGVIAAIATLIGALRKKDTAPAPQVGITATVPPTGDDIDYRAYLDMKERAERAETRAGAAEETLRRLLNRGEHIDEDTQPL